MSDFQLPPVFLSLQFFRDEFNQGLIKLSKNENLGAFILACANATGDKKLLAGMNTGLESSYQLLYKKFQSDFINGLNVHAVEEDLLVFLKLCTMGFHNMQLAEKRNESIWQLQFNQLRSFRPRRISDTNIRDLHCSYDANQFNFNKPFLQKECFWRGELLGRKVDLFYNKYPFTDLHGLLVLNKEECLPQYLEEKNHQYIFKLLNTLAVNFDGLGFAYNSLGAFASVNHLHFQMFVESQRLPICDAQWSHNGGGENYPLECLVFDDGQASWLYIDELQKKNQPFNLLYCDGKVYVIARKFQADVKVPEWSSGFTWYEMMGGVICFNRQAYETLSTADVCHFLNEQAVTS